MYGNPKKLQGIDKSKPDTSAKPLRCPFCREGLLILCVSLVVVEVLVNRKLFTPRKLRVSASDTLTHHQDVSHRKEEKNAAPLDPETQELA